MIQLAALKLFAASWWRAALGAAIAIPPAFLLGQCDGRARERDAVEAAEQKARADAQEKARVADETRRKLEAAATAKITADRKEVDNATAQIPDQAPSARQRARACLELRRSGRLDANAPC